MRRRTPELYDILASVRRAIEGVTLARIADCFPGERLIANPAVAVAP